MPSQDTLKTSKLSAWSMNFRATSRLAMALGLALALTSACATPPEGDSEDGAAMAGDMTSKGERSATATARDAAGVFRSDSYETTERRLQLERSVDQWWIAFRKQEYAKSDGLATALEQFVNKHYDSVVSDLNASSPRFRKVSAAALGFSGKSEAVQPLTQSLSDPFPDVVLSSLLSLRTLAISGVAVPSTPVVPLLTRTDPDVRANASMVLSHSVQPGDGELYLPLTAAMEDTEPAVRLHVAAALGRLGDGAAIPFLAKGLKDEYPLVRVRSALALARLKDTRAVPHLIEAVGDPKKDVSQAAHRALQEITGRIEVERRREAWEDSWSSRREQTKETIGSSRS